MAVFSFDLLSQGTPGSDGPPGRDGAVGVKVRLVPDRSVLQTLLLSFVLNFFFFLQFFRENVVILVLPVPLELLVPLVPPDQSDPSASRETEESL